MPSNPEQEKKNFFFLRKHYQYRITQQFSEQQTKTISQTGTVSWEKKVRLNAKKEWYLEEINALIQDLYYFTFCHFYPPPPIGGEAVWDVCTSHFPSTPTDPASCGCQVGVALEVRGLVVRRPSNADRRHETSPVVRLLTGPLRPWKVRHSGRDFFGFLIFYSLNVCC